MDLGSKPVVGLFVWPHLNEFCVSCSAVNENVWLVLGCGRLFWPTVAVHFGFLALLFGHPLWEWISPQIRQFLFWRTVFNRMAETLAVVALRNRNWWPKSLHLVYHAGYLANLILEKKSLVFGRVVNFKSKDWEDHYRLFCFLSIQPWSDRLCLDQGIL